MDHLCTKVRFVTGLQGTEYRYNWAVVPRWVATGQAVIWWYWVLPWSHLFVNPSMDRGPNVENSVRMRKFLPTDHLHPSFDRV